MMIQALLSLPTLVGAFVFMTITTALGMAVYYVTFQLHAKRHSDEAVKEIKDATGNLFRVVGWLFTLLLSLTFTDVVSELAVTETVIQSEAAAIDDVHHLLLRFNSPESQQTQGALADYVQAVIEDEWQTLANNRLSNRAEKLLRQVEDGVLNLPTAGEVQKTLRSRAIEDVDRISDFRLARLQQSREQKSIVLYVVLFGYLVTMVYFGIYQPRAALVSLLSLYTVFVGVILYFMLAMSDPFQGATAIDSAPLEYVLEAMRARMD
jgi:transcriptional regulator of NAD metabolism